MSRLELATPSAAQLVVENIYKDMERRIEASPPGLCPVDMTLAFVELCYAQTCGKCVPCRVGLLQIKQMLRSVLDGTADESVIPLLEQTAAAIKDSADCAVGYEAAQRVYESLVACREDYEMHIRHHRCNCTYHQLPPCVHLCPAHVDIPGYVGLVQQGRYADAIRLIKKDNPFPTTCGFICEHPCEARCRRNLVDEPINIRGLKRVAADFAGEVPPPERAPSTGKQVAVVGGGPVGLAAAYYLQIMGHQVTVLEVQSKLGGMLRYGIPNYRLPKTELDKDIAAILATGVNVKYGVRVGEDVTLQQLRREYDAVLISIGASSGKSLGLEHDDAPGIMSAVQFLRHVCGGGTLDLTGQDVVVVGGGNVSMDAARTAIRLGARKVSAVYRRRKLDMTALPTEIEAAVAEGVELVTLSAPARLELDGEGHVAGLWVTPQMVCRINGSKVGVKSNGEPEQLIPCTTLITAIGQSIETEYFESAGIPVSHGKFMADKSGQFTGMPGIFAGGDCATGPATVIQAVAAAKVTAANIDEYLGYRHEITCDVVIPEPQLTNRFRCGRVDLAERDAFERKNDFDMIEQCMTATEACQEAGRCLRCDHFGFGLMTGGRETVW